MEKRYQRTEDDIRFAKRFKIPTISYNEAITALRKVISHNCDTNNSYWFEIVTERDESPLNYCLSAATGEFELTFTEVEDILFEDRGSPYRGKEIFILGKTNEEEEENW